METDIEYVELIIEDFKEPVLYLIQAIFVSLVCLVLVMSIYKIKNMKSRFRQDGIKGRISVMASVYQLYLGRYSDCIFLKGTREQKKDKFIIVGDLGKYISYAYLFY